MPFLLPGSIFIFQIHSMKPTLLLAAFALFLFSCNKKGALEPSKPFVPSEREFALIPTKDAKWYVHIIADNDCFPFADPADLNIEGFKDQMYNAYYIITSTGKDIVVDSFTYHVYDVESKVIDPYSEKPYYQKSSLYLREDTIAQRIYAPGNYLVCDFSDNKNNGQITPFPTWPLMNISDVEGYVVGGEKMKSWSMINIYDKNLRYFYKGIGIGSTTGILPVTFGYTAAQAVSLDFVYKRDSLHFEYPLH